VLRPIRESLEPQPPAFRFRPLLTEGMHELSLM